MVGKILEVLIKFGGPLLELLGKVSTDKGKQPTRDDTIDHIGDMRRDVDEAERRERALFSGK